MDKVEFTCKEPTLLLIRSKSEWKWLRYGQNRNFIASHGLSGRPGKSCESSSSGKFRALQCPQNSVIHDKGQRETCVSNVGVA